MNGAAAHPDQLNYYHGAPLGSAQFKTSAADFIVDEQYTPTLDGGEHLYLRVEKRDQNSLWVAQRLAERAGIEPRAVGLCGLKDRTAITRQWYSLHLPGRELPLSALADSDYAILASGRGVAKLRRGDHSGNQFTIVLRRVSAAAGDIEARLTALAEGGFANYFGAQRFGRNANNLVEVERLVAAGKLVGDRGRQRSRGRRGSAPTKSTGNNGLLLSAARSWLYNQVLHARLADRSGPLSRDDDGPLWGRGRSAAADPLAAREANWLAPWQSWCHALEHGGLSQQRRPLLAYPQALSWQWLDGATLQLSFGLAAGQYATAMLRELVELQQPQLTQSDAAVVL